MLHADAVVAGAVLGFYERKVRHAAVEVIAAEALPRLSAQAEEGRRQFGAALSALL